MKRILTLAFFAFATPAHASSIDGNKLLEICTQSQSSADYVYASIACNNYIVGVVDGYIMGNEAQDSLSMPEVVSGKQLQEITIKFLKEHPDKLNMPARFLIIIGLLEAFPKMHAPGK